MKRITSVLLVVGFVLVFFSSCTIEKRVYSSGYHVEWKKNHRITNQYENTNVRKEDKSALRQAQDDSGNRHLTHSTGSGLVMTEEKDISQTVTLNPKPALRLAQDDNSKPLTFNPKPETLNPISADLHFTKRGLAVLGPKEGKNVDELFLGILLFVGGIISMVAVAYAYSGFNPLPGVALFLLILCFLASMVGYILIEQAVPGLGCLLLTLFQIFAAVLG